MRWRRVVPTMLIALSLPVIWMATRLTPRHPDPFTHAVGQRSVRRDWILGDGAAQRATVRSVDVAYRGWAVCNDSAPVGYRRAVRDHLAVALGGVPDGHSSVESSSAAGKLKADGTRESIKPDRLSRTILTALCLAEFSDETSELSRTRSVVVELALLLLRSTDTLLHSAALRILEECPIEARERGDDARVCDGTRVPKFLDRVEFDLHVLTAYRESMAVVLPGSESAHAWIRRWRGLARGSASHGAAAFERWQRSGAGRREMRRVAAPQYRLLHPLGGLAVATVLAPLIDRTTIEGARWDRVRSRFECTEGGSSP